MTFDQNQSEPVVLAKLIKYQPGSVVSREIINKPTGTVTLFAFDKGQGLSEHQAPYEAFIFLLEGETEMMVDGKKHHLVKGETFLIPANCSHSLKAVENFKMLLVMIKS